MISHCVGGYGGQQGYGGGGYGGYGGGGGGGYGEGGYGGGGYGGKWRIDSNHLVEANS